MKKTNVKISSVLDYQLPEFIRVEYPLLIEFLKEYYRKEESDSNAYDIAQNITEYIKPDTLTEIEDTFYIYQEETFDIQSLVKVSSGPNATILDGESLVKITTQTPHNFVDGDLVDIVPNPVISPFPQDIVSFDPNTPFRGVRFNISVISDTEFFLLRSGSGISDREFNTTEEFTVGKVLKSDINIDDNRIVIYSKSGNFKSLPSNYGLIKINDEIILYKDIDRSKELILNINEVDYKAVCLIDCVRGFSGVTSLDANIDDSLVFEETLASSHLNYSEVKNLNAIFLIEFLNKLKKQFLPGFEGRDLFEDLNENIFLKQSKDFYASKGTDTSFKILFSALYGKKVSIIKPRDYLLESSDAEFRVVKDLVVEVLDGDPEELVNRTLFQDDFGFIRNAKGTVSFVERIVRNERVYYIISIDDGYERDINFRGTLFSEFSIHPKTSNLNFVPAGSTTIDVDSTVGFPSSGDLVIKTIDPATNIELSYEIEYTSKTLNQFLGCITKNEIVKNIVNPIYENSRIFTNAFAYGFGSSGNIIKVRISGVLSNFEQQEKTFLYESGNKIRVSSLGLQTKEKRNNDWVYNIPLRYIIDSAKFESSNGSQYVYRLTFQDDFNFFKFDEFRVEGDLTTTVVVDSVTTTKEAILTFSKNMGDVDPQGFVPELANKTIIKKISKVEVENYPQLNIYNSNIQNVYIDSQKSTYVASPSLPKYGDPLQIRDGSVSGSFNFGKETPSGFGIDIRDRFFTDGSVDYSYLIILDSNGDALEHGFFTGDEVIFRSLNDTISPFENGIYYIQEFRNIGDPFGIKLSTSRGNLLNQRYVTPESSDISDIPFVTVADCIIQYAEFTNVDFKSDDNLLPQILDTQKLIRKVQDPILDLKKSTTKNGAVGIFKNGVEILNYKSKDDVFYGPIENVNVIAPGDGYDVINPPVLTIEDFGGASLTYNAKNSLQLIFNGFQIKFGVTNDLNPITFGGSGGTPIEVGGKSLLLGTKKLFVNQVGGTIVRVNNLVLSLGGENGTPLGIGGEDGTLALVGDEKITFGNIGSGCVIYPKVVGKLERFDILYPGFNYVKPPKVSITGGNGSGAIIEPVMETFVYKANFFPNSTNIDLNENTIGFSTYHNFENFEEVTYTNPKGFSVGGLDTNARYNVKVVDPFKVKLFKSLSDSVAGISTVNITSTSSGVHVLRSTKNKSRISSLNVVNSGSNFTSRKVSTNFTNVNVVTNIITIPNHGFLDGELIIHYSNGTPIGGLLENTNYYVTKIDNNNIKLSEVSKDVNTAKDFLYQTRQYVNILNSGSGTHFFDYPPVKVEISGFIGVSTSGNQDLNAIVRPIVRGKIESIFVEDGGQKYGSNEILNYSKQPNLSISKGKNASFLPLINESSGEITEIIITNSGSDYISTPDIVVRGDGTGAVLVPIIVDNKITKIEVLYGGTGYTKDNILIEAIDRGEGLKTFCDITKWNVNLLERYRSTGRETPDGGFMYSGLNSNYGLQYTHLYLPDNFRKIVYNQDSSNNRVVDFEADRSNSKRHSPIVGWAYDGNPIYGPYGYSNGISGEVRALRSGYKLKQSTERENGPSFNLYFNGFFVEDYEFKESDDSDLDISNGRFCITPEYPNGVYAYFCTVDTDSILVEGKGYPQTFPYVIGNVYKSKPIEFNFSVNSNQDEIDINKTNWYRNTTPYNIVNKIASDYDYLLIPNRIKDPISKVKFASYGEVQSVDIIVEGTNYKVGERIEFENSDVIGQDSTASISIIGGKEVRSVSIARSIFENVEFEKIDNSSELVGYTETPHGYTSGDIVSITTPIERIIFKDINFNENNLFLTKNVPLEIVTGIVTYFEVTGNLSPEVIRENDIYRIVSDNDQEEDIQILNVDRENKVIRVLREYNSVVSTSEYGLGTRLVEKSRKFNCNLGIQTFYNLKTNYDYHFDANESVGLGTEYGNGITTSLKPKYSINEYTPISIPTRSIFLKDHGFSTNEQLIYSNDDGALRATSDETYTNDFNLPERVFAVKLNDDLIGLSTSKVGFGTTGDQGQYRNIEDPLDKDNPLLSFTLATGRHRFTTQRENILTAKVAQNIVTVSTSSTHGLLKNDIVNISVSPEDTKTFVVEYNDSARLLVLNPKEFVADDVDISGNTFNIQNHDYLTGDKVIYKSENPMVGLEDNEIYYVVAIDRNIFGIVNSLYETTVPFPEFINFTTKTDGTFYAVNPKIEIIKGQTLNFDLSSETLSFQSGTGSLRSSSFDFDIFEDANFNHIFVSSQTNNFFDVTKTGRIGVDSNAAVSVKILENTPDTLYYKLFPLNVTGNPVEKLGYFVDTEQISYNKISIIKSKFDGFYKIFDPIERDPLQPPFEYPEFKYQIPTDPESDGYILDSINNTNVLPSATVSYNTSSSNAFGPIKNVTVKNKGRYFYKLPSKTSIISEVGSGAIVSANSKNIGEIKTVDINDIGFDYPSDLSIRPIAKLPTIYKVEPLYSFKTITVKNSGTNYLQAPEIIVIDSKTEQEINDVTLKYSLGDDFVTILQNTKNLSNVVPRLIPVNNTNGISLLLTQSDPILLDINNNSDNDELINANDNANLPDDAPESSYQLPDSLPFTNLTTIQVFLSTEYSSIFDFPFELGDLVLLEDIVTIEETNGGTSKGFNSSNYGYAYYKVVRRDPNIGGQAASITLDFSGYIPDEELSFAEDSDSYKVDEIISESAKIVPVKFFPVYEVTLEKNDFIIDEELINLRGDSLGVVEQWDNSNDYIKIAETINFESGDKIIGQTSKTKANLLSKLEFDAGYLTGSSSIVNKGWQVDTGKLNTDLQRTGDSDYYQYFSYSLKSEIPIDKWDEPVGSLNHTSGFKRFSELEIETNSDDFSGISTSQNAGVTFGIADYISEVSVNCVYDFDLARELLFGNNPVKSNEILFNSRILQDYIESVGNRVLNIDDISKDFIAVPRDSIFSIVSRSDSVEIRSRKFFFYTQDRRFVNEKQMDLLTTIHNDEFVYLGQYGRLETVYDMAFFDSEIIGEQQNLKFFPTKTEINNFLVDFVVLEMTDDPEDVDNIEFGDVVSVYNQVGIITDIVDAGIAKTVVGIGTTFVASKLLVQTGSATTNYYQLNEILVLRDDVGNVKLQEYGELTSGPLVNEGLNGIASFSAKLSDDENFVDIVMTPFEDLDDDYNVKTITISIASTDFTTTGTLGLETGEVSSFTYSGIGTDIPQGQIITNYTTQQKCSYIFNYVVGVQTGSFVPVSYGDRNHGVSDWIALSDGDVTYSAIYPNTDIVGVNTLGYRETVLSTGTDPQRGTIGIQSGFLYYGSEAVHFLPENDHWKIAPVSYAGTTFGNYVSDRGSPSGISTFYVYAPFEDAIVNQYDADPNGILGISSDTISVKKYSVGILTSSVADDWVFFNSNVDVIISSQGPDGLDSSLLAPSVTGIGSTSHKYFAYIQAASPPSPPLGQEVYGVTAYNGLVGITTAGVNSLDPVIAIQRDFDPGFDDIQGILPDFICDTYSWGNTLSDYQIVAPYSNTSITVSYWNGTDWIIGEVHSLDVATFSNPQQAVRDGNNGFGVWGETTSGTAANLAAGLGDGGIDPNLWKFEGNQPFALFLNDTSDKEEAMLGFTSSFSTRPLNKEYRSSEIQMINDQTNSYISEFGTVTIPSASGVFDETGIGTFSSSLVGSNTNLVFTPSPLTQFEVRGYQINVGRF